MDAAADVTTPTCLPSQRELRAGLRAAAVAPSHAHQPLLHLVVRVEPGDHFLADVAAFGEADDVYQAGLQRVEGLGKLAPERGNAAFHSHQVEGFPTDRRGRRSGIHGQQGVESLTAVGSGNDHVVAGLADRVRADDERLHATDGPDAGVVGGKLGGRDAGGGLHDRRSSGPHNAQHRRRAGHVLDRHVLDEGVEVDPLGDPALVARAGQHEQVAAAAEDQQQVEDAALVRREHSGRALADLQLGQGIGGQTLHQIDGVFAAKDEPANA